MNPMNIDRNRFLLAMIVSAAASRLIPHPPNFTAVGALALFSGVHIGARRLSFLAPLVALFLSDLILGFHPVMPWVYGSFGLIVCLGFWVRHKLSVSRLAAASLTG